MNKEELFNIISQEFYNDKHYKRDNKNFDAEIEKIVDELLDKDAFTVTGLGVRGTYLLRKYYGVLDNGKRFTAKEIAQEEGVGTSSIASILGKIRRTVFEVISYKLYKYKKSRNTISSLRLSEYYEQLKDVKMADLGFDQGNLSYLFKCEIITLEDLLCCNRYPFEDTRLLESLHRLNIKFKNELNRAEKAKLISMMDEKEKSCISTSFLENNKKLNYYRNNRLYRNREFSTIKEVIYFVNSTPDVIDIDILQELQDLGFEVSEEKLIQSLLNDKTSLESSIQTISEQNYSLNKLKIINLRFLNLSESMLKAFKTANLNTIGDIINLNTFDLFKIPGLDNENANAIINAVHGLNLFFRDEIDVLKEYSIAIHEQLDSQNNSSQLKKVIK